MKTLSFSNSTTGSTSLLSCPATGTIVLIVDNIVSTPCTHVVQPIIATMSQPLLHTSTNINSMQTRSKSGIYKPKVYTTIVALLDHFQEPSSVQQALQLPHWKTTMEAEYSALVRNGTWRLVPKTKRMHIVLNKWIFKTKLKAYGSLDKFKARLVAKGFQQHAGVDFSDTCSPVVKASSIRIIFTLVIAYNWDIHQIYINNAFLNGILHEDVHMCQLEGFVSSTHPTHVYKLIKSLYGLKQAP